MRAPLRGGPGLLLALLTLSCAHGGPARTEAPMSTAPSPTRTIVLVHGMFMTPSCWKGWIARYEGRGYTMHAPAWPGHDLPVAEQRRRHPDPARGALTLGEVVDSYDKI